MGDELDPVFGKRFGKHKYHIFSDKTVEGSIAFFFFGFIGALLFNLLFFGQINILLLIAAAVVTSVIEGFSPKDIDNILIPLSSMIVYYLFL